MTRTNDMISRQLATAIKEAIQQHADRHYQGIIDLEQTLSALGDVASGLLAELRTTDDRVAHYSALIDGVKTATATKILVGLRLTTKQSRPPSPPAWRANRGAAAMGRSLPRGEGEA